MDDAELKRLDALCANLDGAKSDHAGLTAVAFAAAELPAALAEIRRLRDLVDRVEWVGEPGYGDATWCPWCDSPRAEKTHGVDCDAFTIDGKLR